MSDRRVYFTISQGRYNLIGDEKTWLLCLVTPFGRVSETFEEEPSFGDSIEDVLDVIEARVESWWISTSREENRKLIAAIRENLTECELMYAEAKLGRLRANLAETQKQIEATEKLASSLKDDLAEKAQ